MSQKRFFNNVRETSVSKLIYQFLPIIDLIFFPFVLISASLLKAVRAAGVRRLPLCKEMLFRVGCFPIRDHYYEPLFNRKHLRLPLSENRNLPGIDWNIDEQFGMLNSFVYSKELADLSASEENELDFSLENTTFCSGDFEYWYNLIRLKKPRRIIEIGSGYSTLMAIKAIKTNKIEDPTYACDHTCIEPYEMPWLNKTDALVIRQKVEEIGKKVFVGLGNNDILFIDSSHIIRPQGDVIFECLELLPQLSKGVIVHFHDIFSPKDYPEEWIVKDVRFWNEQYLLEAFLTSNADWKIIGALNFLHHNHYEKLKEKCPFLTKDREPGSFYIQKIR